MSRVPKHVLSRQLLIGFSAVALSGCASLWNPYLSTGKLDSSVKCPSDKVCSGAQRMQDAVDGVTDIQNQAREAYTSRGRLNTASSALAFPVVGWLLYRGTTATTDAGRNVVLKGGIAAGAAYEARNALTANSPESVYQLADARLGCVLDESTRYRTDYPSTSKNQQSCDQDLADLSGAMEVLDSLNLQDKTNIAARTRLTTKAKGLIQQYSETEQTLFEASNAMRKAARKITADTNQQVRTPTISLTEASTFLGSSVKPYLPEKSLTQEHKVTIQGNDDSDDGKFISAANGFISRLNNFAVQCIRPQPASTSGFEACTKFSPDAPPAPSITTTLPGTELTLNVGDSLSLVATSRPSGTPWAIYASNGAVATQALGELRQVTLTPTQTQISATYSKAVPTDTEVVVSISTLGAPQGSALPITVMLKAAPAPGAAPAATTTTTTTTTEGDTGTTMANILADQDLLAKLPATTPHSEVAVTEALRIIWTKACGKPPTSMKVLMRKDFLDAVKANKGLNKDASFCK